MSIRIVLKNTTIIAVPIVMWTCYLPADLRLAVVISLKPRLVNTPISSAVVSQNLYAVQNRRTFLRCLDLGFDQLLSIKTLFPTTRPSYSEFRQSPGPRTFSGIWMFRRFLGRQFTSSSGTLATRTGANWQLVNRGQFPRKPNTQREPAGARCRAARPYNLF